jgi:DNA-binding transcriptional ArsR family regulator
MISDELSVTFAALADPTRRSILARLARGEATVTELAAPHAMSLPAISRHLKVLQQAGLVTQGRDAQWRPCRLATYREFFESRFDALAEHLSTMVRDRQPAAPEPQPEPEENR